MSNNLLGSPFSQMAYVTNDMDRALTEFADTFGVTKFFRTDNAEYAVGSGRVAICHVAVAVSGGVQIEVIQPIGGESQLYRTVLDGDDYQLRHHHVAYFPETLEQLGELRDGMRAAGFELVVDATGPYGSYFYADTRRSLGHYIECICFEPVAFAALQQIVPVN
ncbi:VOC family protein [Rhodococcus koreensis]